MTLVLPLSAEVGELMPEHGGRPWRLAMKVGEVGGRAWRQGMEVGAGLREECSIQVQGSAQGPAFWAWRGVQGAEENKGHGCKGT